ncbi:MAG TPA: hypothetical protein VGB08_06835 [Allosphingosinicella sp.]|jgi:hypothetical protein
MKSGASLLASIIIGAVALFLALKLLGAALKLVGVLIAVALAVGAYFVVRGMVEKGGRSG